MLAYQAGSEEAFDRLVRACSGTVFGLLTRFLGPVPDREDLVQEVFLRVVRARARYRPEARFTTWLFRITFNLAVNRTQRARPESSLDDHDGDGARPEPAGGEPPSAGLERADVTRAVREAIAALPEQQRIALLLAKYEELPYAEIAQVLETSEQAVKSLVHRARATLRARLAPFAPFAPSARSASEEPA
jgi:RNA polymerase sigma-70 factor (ECF subfamily)